MVHTPVIIRCYNVDLICRCLYRPDRNGPFIPIASAVARMEQRMNPSPSENHDRWRSRVRQGRAWIRRSVPFASGVLASLLALLLYNTLFPAALPLTQKEVDQTVAQAMASATAPPSYASQVYQSIQPSLVLIQSHGPRGASDQDALGSGVVVSDMGDILTSLHVVEGASRILVIFADGTQSGAQIVAEQPENDIAVLRADEPPEFIVPAVLGNPNAMSIGDEAYAVGNPFGLYGSMSAGVISGFNRSFNSPENGRELQGLIQIDSAVNPGNSGGPLLNRHGHVVGIIVGILNPTEDEVFIGIGFAVPITVAGGAAGSPPY